MVGGTNRFPQSQLHIAPTPADVNPESFEDEDFTAGDSPFVADVNSALGRNGSDGVISNDGPGPFTVEFSTDGISYGDPITIKGCEKFPFEALSVDSIRFTHSGDDSAYRLVVI